MMIKTQPLYLKIWIIADIQRNLFTIILEIVHILAHSGSDSMNSALLTLRILLQICVNPKLKNAPKTIKCYIF